MIFKTYGDKSKKACIFIHGMLSTGDGCLPYGKYFFNDYFVVIPTLDSHYEGSKTIENEKDEARQILDFIHKENITEIALVHGTSMGALVAFSFLTISDVKVDNYFFDGGPFFKFGKFVKSIFRKIVIRTVKKYKNTRKEELLKDDSIKVFIKNSEKSFDEIYHDYNVVFDNYLKDGTMNNLMSFCYSFEFPKISTDSNVVFFYSKKEPANKCIKKLKKNYPECKYVIDEVEGHCGAQNDNPLRYSEIIKANII